MFLWYRNISILHLFHIKTNKTNHNKGSCLPHNPTEDKIQDDIGNLETEKKASDSYSENPLSKDKEKDMALNKLPSLDKYRSSSKTETENTLKLDTRKISLPLSSSDDKNIKNMNHK